MAKTTIVIEEYMDEDCMDVIAYVDYDRTIQGRATSVSDAVARLFLRNREKLGVEFIRPDKTIVPDQG